MALHQAPRQQRPKAAGATGDQHGALRVERPGLAVRRLGPREPRRVGRAVAEGQLRLVARGKRLPRRVVAVQVDQHEATGVLGLRASHQAPDGGPGRIRIVAVARGHRAACHDRQPCVGEPLLGEPRLEQLERLPDALMRVGRRDGREHDVGRALDGGEAVVALGVEIDAVAQHREAVRARLRQGGLDPLQTEQRVPLHTSRAAQLARLDRPRHERIDRQHRRARLVRRRDPEAALGDELHAEAEPLGAAAVEAHAVP